MNGRRVLVVDDDLMACRLLRLVFAGTGVEVTTAHTVGEGLALLATPFDYIILDISLPDGDGRAILERVREEGQPTRVAITSGWAPLDEGSADIVLCKPIDPDELMRGLGVSA